MSARTDQSTFVGSNGDENTTLATIEAAQNVNTPFQDVTSHESPLSRSIAVSVRASLEDLCLRKAKASWCPSAEATAAILKQNRFTDLKGNAEKQGDLKSVVMHKMSMRNIKNTFPIAVGCNITGVEPNTFSITGSGYSTIVLPAENSQTGITLNNEDCSLAYEFARKFPGYTAQNLTEKGVHTVQSRNFCLINADHPMVSAISENHERLQVGEISMMPEGLVKISTSLYDSMIPMVKAQVESQIKVNDMTNMSLGLDAAEFSSWKDARTNLISEAKRGLQARLENELASCTDKSAVEGLRSEFNRKERELEHDIDHQVHTFSAILDMEYNFLAP